jgi:hypothetical protein
VRSGREREVVKGGGESGGRGSWGGNHSHDGEVEDACGRGIPVRLVSSVRLPVLRVR